MAWRGVTGIRLDATFQPIDPLPFTVCGANEYQDASAVASDGTDFFVVWHDRRNRGIEPTSDIYGTRVTATGQVLDPNGVAIEVNTIGKQRQNGAAAIAYSPGAGRYFVAWSATSPNNGTGDGRSEVRGAEIERTGVVRAPGSYTVSPAPYLRAEPSLSVMDGSKVLVSYSRFDPSPPYGSRRLRTRIVDLDGTGGLDAGADGSVGDGGSSDGGGGDGGSSDGGSSSGSSGSDGSPDDDGGDGGTGGGEGEPDCGCRVVGVTPSTGGSLGALAAGLIFLLRRRRRSR